ncbi:hypothetical protein [Hirschia maritima]|uniref:hypothetical protein n=1 Tax=Hirschia maritima TaxID=1121961 RepID=UPI000381A417|nr:hypothetical protein [Hirschia maritima]
MKLVLSGCVFELIENSSGHAAEKTIMSFSPNLEICSAIYSGPNIEFGQVLVSDDCMLYHALDKAGKLAAGQAKISIQQDDSNDVFMKLEWSWLSSDSSSGESLWKLVKC